MAVLTKNAMEILNDRYLLKNNEGVIVETADQLFKRVAKFVSAADNRSASKLEKQFFEVMDTLDFLPNSPTLMNAGIANGQLSACFVLPVEDSLENIFTTLKNAALIHQSGGGTGFNFSNLRPKNDIITSSAGTSSGPVAFIKIFDAATEYVKQGGRRRGANMGILNIDHPDIEEFITSKSDKDKLQNFNISVGITNDYMKAVIDDLEWKLINPRTKLTYKTLKARYLWQMIVHEAWKTGDPGLIFLDTINKSNPTPHLGKIKCTNPCGEVPLLDYESCNLGSLNLSHMVTSTSKGMAIDWNKLQRTIEIAITFLDNIITVNHYLLEQTAAIATTNRKIGLGVMGWAEMLIRLEIPYASEKAVELGEKLMKFIQEKSYESSEKIAKTKGTFPSWSNSTHASSFALRNASCNSIAPTGTISVIADTSYSIEPLYALAFKRSGILDGKTQFEINKLFLQKMKSLGLWSEELKKKILKDGTLTDINYVPNNIKEIFETSLEIHWKYHLKHQVAFQKFTDNAVSKTINLPETTTEKEISELYQVAWMSKLKGITIYRNGCRDEQVLQKCNFNTLNDCQ